MLIRTYYDPRETVINNSAPIYKGFLRMSTLSGTNIFHYYNYAMRSIKMSEFKIEILTCIKEKDINKNDVKTSPAVIDIAFHAHSKSGNRHHLTISYCANILIKHISVSLT